MYKHVLPYFILAAALLQYGCKKEPVRETENRPASFDLVSVPDKQTGTDVLPTLTWKRSGGPGKDKVWYKVLLESNNGKSITAAADLVDTFYTFDTRLETNTFYQWKVEAKDDQGNTRLSSSTFSFTTRAMNAPAIASGNATSVSRLGHTTVAFKDKLWVIGGVYGPRDFYLNDVWSSTDGISWESVNASASFSPRKNHSSVVFDNKIWVIGGRDGRNHQDVWYTENGIHWTKATEAPFKARNSHATVVYDNKIWMLGGVSTDGSLNDVWYSENGKNWIQATDNAPFSKRYATTAVVFENKLWVVSGWDTTATGSIWYTTNGRDWTLATDNPAFGKRRGHTVTVFDNKLWLIGGSTPIGPATSISTPKNDIWFSSDGIHWTQFLATAAFSEREFHTAIAYHNKLLVLFGGVGYKSFNDVWSIE